MAKLKQTTFNDSCYKYQRCIFLFKSDQVQLVVLLERLLERDAIATTTLTQLDNCYHFAEKNAEVS